MPQMPGDLAYIYIYIYIYIYTQVESGGPMPQMPGDLAGMTSHMAQMQLGGVSKDVSLLVFFLIFVCSSLFMADTRTRGTLKKVINFLKNI